MSSCQTMMIENETGSATQQLRELARQACKKHDVIDEAVEAVYQGLIAQPDVFDLMVEPALRMAIRETIYDVRHDEGSRVKYAPADTTRGPDVLALVSRVGERSLLELAMPNGRRLGDQLGSDLRPLAEECRRQANGNLRRAALCEALADRVPDGEAVRDHVTTEDVRELWSAIMRDIPL